MSSTQDQSSRLRHHDLRSNEALKADGLNDEEIERFRNAEGGYYGLLVELDEAEAEKDYGRILEIEEKLPNIEFRLKYQGKHPRDIPVEEMRKLIENGANTLDDQTTRRYHAKVKNPATGVRAFCVTCMGGQPGEVRHCGAVTCPLWAFRTGKNPYFGKALPPIRNIEVEDDDYVEIDESADGADAEE